MEDLYATLGVSRSAGIDEIKKKYRRLARELHPDVRPNDAQAEERFKRVSAAFDVLSNPEKKKLYDEFGEEALRPGFDAEQARAYKQWHDRAGSGFQGGFGGGGFNGGFGGGFSFDDLFGGGFGDIFGGRREAAPRRGGDARAAITIDLRDAVLGAERDISFQRPDGQSRRLKVKIPAGTEDGGTLRLAGQGSSGPAGPGDLLLEISVRPHPHVRREGHDLFLEVPVTVREAMLGARIEVPTFQGPIKLAVPAGSQSGDTLRIRGRGVGGRAPGDLHVVLKVRLPDPKQPGAKEAAETLEGAYDGDVRSGLRL